MDIKKFKRYEQRALSTVYSEEVGGFHDDLIPEIVKRFLPEFNLDKTARIVDIGCGPGVFMAAVKTEGFDNCVGVTLSQEDVDVCISRGFKCINASMTDLPMPDRSVDFIWCRHALEHSPYPIFTLYEFERVLRTGGSIFIEVPAPDNERRHMHEFNANHYSILGECMWQALFEKAGLKATNVWHYSIDIPFPVDNKIYNERSYMFRIIKL
jgi:SAM-dependent methyltransferase